MDRWEEIRQGLEQAQKQFSNDQLAETIKRSTASWGLSYPSFLFKGFIALSRGHPRALSTLEISNHYQREKHLFGI